jgi:histidine ammonia-lyase
MGDENKPKPLVLIPGCLTLADLRYLAAPGASLELAPESYQAVDKTSNLVRDIVKSGTRTYGVNTGVGTLSDRSIAAEDVAELQRRLILSNAAGTGPLLSDRVVRWMLALKINVLATGLSGVRREIIDALVVLFNSGLVPGVPSKGSVGASGDLAPLAHMAATLIGEGEIRRNGKLEPAKAALNAAGIPLFQLAAKEGLAMVNGTQASLALAVDGLLQAESVFAAAVVAGALSTEAALGQASAFDPRIHEFRHQKGQIEIAAVYRSLLESSEIREQAKRDGRIQDPYSLRCQPQVMGTCLDFLRFGAEILTREINAVTDNPLVDPESGDLLYGGNFHAEPVGMAADALALPICEIGAMSERRIALLTDANHSKLPAFLAGESGLDSGFMVAQVTAAALTSENKHLANPVSTDTIPTTGNHEDFVSMATHAARRLSEMTENAAAIVAIELLAACQGLEFRRPAKSSKALEEVVAGIREKVPPYTEDRYFAPDLEAIKRLVLEGRFIEFIPAEARPTQ